MINVLKLILEMKKRPCLWDPKNEEYTDRERRKCCWNEVASAVMTDYTPEMKHKLSLVQRKWKSTRDYYKKECRGINACKRRYVYAEVLDFLDPILKTDDSSPSRPMLQISNSYQDVSDYNSNECLDMGEDVSTDEEYEETAEMLPEPSSSKSKMKDKNRLKSDPLATEDDDSISDHFESNSDKLFLLSFLPDIKSLNEDDKLEFKIRMFKTLKEIKYERQKSLVQTSTEKNAAKKPKRVAENLSSDYDEAWLGN